MTGLRQQSVVTIGPRELTVVSEVLLDPEPLIVTQVLAGTDVLKKSHVVLAASVVDDFHARGDAALVATLNVSHLRFVRRLLTANADGDRQGLPAPAGVVATQVLGVAGERRSTAGEDNVPPSWLRAGYLVAGIATVMTEQLGLGSLVRATADGTGLALRLVQRADSTAVAFVTGESAADPVWAYLEETR